jgi:hypothetical protein
VRLALIGPVGESEAQLDSALEFAFRAMLADRAVYLGEPELVERRRQQVRADVDDSLWSRSLRCLDAEAEAIARFVEVERSRLDWARLDALGELGGLCIALPSGSALVACFELDETRSEVAEAQVVVCPRADVGIDVREDSSRVLLAPGDLDSAGVMLLTDEAELSVEWYDLRGKQLDRRVFDLGSRQTG